MNKEYYVYILTNHKKTVLYTGVTNNLVRRIYEHRNKVLEGFTKKYNVNILVYYENLDSPEQAITREKQIKNLLRVKKEELIRDKNPDWQDL